MRKLFVCAVLVMGIAFLGVTSALAATKDTVSASVSLTGTPMVEVTEANLTWSGVTLGVTGWKAGDTLLQVKYLLGTDPDTLKVNTAVVVYTDNANNVPGLVTADGKASIPLAWRIFNATDDATADELTVYEWVYHETDFADDPLTLDKNEGDINGNGKTGEDIYVSKLTDQSKKPDHPIYDLDGDGPKTGAYPCWLWMKDGPTVEAYAQVVNLLGIHHAESNDYIYNWGTWGGSPDYVAIAANFTKGTVNAYSTTIVFEMVSM